MLHNKEILERSVINEVQGFQTIDGAGVHLVRVLGAGTVDVYDPILMLDSFDSTNPDDYTAGFPMHPHRGIETISYVYKGKMMHRDSLGHEDTISDGEVQWMTAGSGILHEELLPASERMLGVQLWLNLPKQDKMVAPAYHSIKTHEIEEIALPNGLGKLRLLAGQYEGHEGFKGQYLDLDYYDIHLEKEGDFLIKTDNDRSILIFTLRGSVNIGNKVVNEKTAAKLSSGNIVRLNNNGEFAQVLFVSSTRLNEPISWGGPIVMNSEEELKKPLESCVMALS